MVIDGQNYKCEWVRNSLKRKADILNGSNSGRLQDTMSMYLDFGGTFFNYTGKIIRTKNCSDNEWEQIYLKFAAPINQHVMTFPFGQGTITQDVYISNLEDVLIDIRDGVNHWSNTIDVQFVAINSMWLAGQSIRGVSQ